MDPTYILTVDNPAASSVYLADRDGNPTEFAGKLVDGQQMTLAELRQAVGRDDLILQSTTTVPGMYRESPETAEQAVAARAERGRAAAL